MSEPYPNSQTCPKCLSALPADANGLCPACLLAEVKKPSEPKKKWEPPSAEELAKLLPQYEITRMLGRGGMGAVYQGTQKSLDRAVAIKILSGHLEDSDMGFKDRFKNEARAMAKLTHPGIVAVYDSGETADGLLYIVMEFIEGTDVARMIAKDKRLHSEHAMAITAHVCDALAYAHERGIIHRDIKPANIMVGYDGVVKVADFGLAKISQEGKTGLTQSGMAMGTLHYMAPEALTLGAAVDQRADIYAVGVMLYQMLTGKLPQGMFELPSMQVPGLDPRYDGIISKALREDRELRYPSTLDMRHDLDAILTQPVVKVDAAADKAPAALEAEARPQGSAGQPYRPPQRSAPPAPKKKFSIGVILAGIAVLAVIVVALFFLSDKGDAVSQSVQATKDKPFINTLGMKFVPVPITGGPTDKQRVLFSVWETRVQDYEVFVKATSPKWVRPIFAQGPTHPATGMAWDQAKVFCEWLTEQERKAGKITTTEAYRLPTDHEWSCAVGIGDKEDAAKTPADKTLAAALKDIYPWGTAWPPPADSANLGGAELGELRESARTKALSGLVGYHDGFPRTSPVGSFSADGPGLFDLGGNVREWCSDLYDPSGDKRVLRGGAWLFSDAPNAHSSRRQEFQVGGNWRSEVIGFRVVLALGSSAAVPSQPASQSEPGYTALLVPPGYLSGWKEHGEDGGVEFADGVLTLKPRKNFSGCYWYAKQAFSDFNLRLQFKLTQQGVNSGVMLRFDKPDEYKLHYDVDLSNDPNPLERTGAIMFVKAATTEPQKMGEWNDLEISASGQNYRVWVNGIIVNEFTGDRRTSGYIGFQLGRPTVQFRNVRIKDATR